MVTSSLYQTCDYDTTTFEGAIFKQYTFVQPRQIQTAHLINAENERSGVCETNLGVQVGCTDVVTR